MSVNRGTVLQTHLFHDRIMRVEPVTMRRGSALGPRQLVLRRRVEERAPAAPGSLVMRRGDVPSDGNWAATRPPPRTGDQVVSAQVLPTAAPPRAGDPTPRRRDPRPSRSTARVHRRGPRTTALPRRGPRRRAPGSHRMTEQSMNEKCGRGGTRLPGSGPSPDPARRARGVARGPRTRAAPLRSGLWTSATPVVTAPPRSTSAPRQGRPPATCPVRTGAAPRGASWVWTWPGASPWWA
ncbi:hypothetical protein QJS66_01890 [Kocuria rhizophila]|nr:hypothetical protein QJS66_01890 [Kocuria rhizophila]